MNNIRRSIQLWWGGETTIERDDGSYGLVFMPSETTHWHWTARCARWIAARPWRSLAGVAGTALSAELLRRGLGWLLG